jgi:hypothetical protein
MHEDHRVFIAGVEELRKVIVTFVSKDDGGLDLTRACAPMDYGPRRRAKDQSPCYHFWDYDSDSPRGPHPLSLSAMQILSIDEIDDHFDPAEFITWPQPYDWFYPRDWGQFS